MVKIKDNNHHLAIAIKQNYSAGMKAKDIANLFNISKQRVNYWIHSSIKTRNKNNKANTQRNKHACKLGQR